VAAELDNGDASAETVSEGQDNLAAWHVEPKGEELRQPDRLVGWPEGERDPFCVTEQQDPPSYQREGCASKPKHAS